MRQSGKLAIRTSFRTQALNFSNRGPPNDFPDTNDALPPTERLSSRWSLKTTGTSIACQAQISWILWLINMISYRHMHNLTLILLKDWGLISALMIANVNLSNLYLASRQSSSLASEKKCISLIEWAKFFVQVCINMAHCVCPGQQQREWHEWCTALKDELNQVDPLEDTRDYLFSDLNKVSFKIFQWISREACSISKVHLQMAAWVIVIKLNTSSTHWKVQSLICIQN